MKHTENWGKNIEVKVAKFYLLRLPTCIIVCSI